MQNDAGIIFDFENSQQLSNAIQLLLNDEQLRKNISNKGMHRMASTAWENAAIAHAMLFSKTGIGPLSLKYNLPPINLNHFKNLTTDFGMIQFSKIDQPDISSGYTLDDNARALIAMCQHFELTLDNNDVKYILIYFNFIKHCFQQEGYFLNYVDDQKCFTEQNNSTNLADANGRAVWALGHLISISALLPAGIAEEAEATLSAALLNVNKIHSTRAMAFVIKGLYYCNSKIHSLHNIALMKKLADRLVQMYRHEVGNKWQWFESYMTYANSILPEALLCAWLATGDSVYRDIARTSFEFLLSKTFTENGIKIISNNGWLYKGTDSTAIPAGGEQPIDVAYTIIALSKFYNEFKEDHFLEKMELSFEWFLGNNHLHQIIYNPCTGGCHDGLEEHNVNLNQGAESTVSYLMARLTLEKTLRINQRLSAKKEYRVKMNSLINKESVQKNLLE